MPVRSRIRVHALHLGLALTLAWAAAPARGQPVLRDVDSVEWMVVDSMMVARGAFVVATVEKIPDGVEWVTATFRVDETLKGEHRPEVRVMIACNSPEAKKIVRWAGEGRPQLGFFRESPRVVAMSFYREYSRFPLAPRTGWFGKSFLDLGPDSEGGAYDLSLGPLGTPEAILKAARDAVAAPAGPGAPYSAWMDPPGEDFLRLTVPVDVRLEERARAWVRSPDKDARRVGAATFKYFRSEANAALLRSLLDDPGESLLDSTDTRNVEHMDRAFLVREEAYLLLKAWGYGVPKPFLRERLR